MVTRRWVGRSIAGLVAASLLCGCASSAATQSVTLTPGPPRTPTAGPTLTPTPAPTPVATATVAPTALAYGPVAVVSGVSTCSEHGLGTVSGDGTSAQHARNGAWKCTDTTNDPRVSGEITANWNMDYWGAPNGTDGAVVQWGTARLVTADGAWEGRATGVYSPWQGDRIVFWWTGTGGYAGLTYFELLIGNGSWTIEGQIFPGSPPQP